MQIKTKIIGVQSKIGQNSKIGSNVTLEVTDKEIIDLQQYYLAVRAGEKPDGKLKRVELHLLYENDLKEVIELPNTDKLDDILKINTGTQNKCECKTPAFIGGKCCNCGGIENVKI